MKDQRLSVYRLSNLPPNLIDIILSLVPPQEAARTCILSKEWRSSWTKIPKLVFDDHNLSFVWEFLIRHQGPIVEFSLRIPGNDTNAEVDKIISYLLTMNTIKKLRLGNLSRIPLEIFSFKQLTHLCLHGCRILQQQTLNGFISRITTLTLYHVEISKKTLVQLLSMCPFLKTFSLPQANEDLIHNDDDSGLIELFECLRVIENLTICYSGILCFDEDEHRPELPTSLYHLKYIYLGDVSFGRDFHYGLPFLALLIRASPNLEKIKLSTFTMDVFDIDSDSDEESDVGEDDYPDIQLKKLNELEIENLGNKKVELKFVKLMLVKSPVLKTLRIFLNEMVTEDEELEMLNILLRCAPASSVVEIILRRHG